MKLKTAVCFTLVVSLAAVSFSGLAQEREWWFDIEIIAYKRNIAQDDISEQFEPGLNLIDSQNSIDILSEFVHPDLTFIRANLPVCFAEPVIPYFPDFKYQYDDSLYANIEYETLIVELPLVDDINQHDNLEVNQEITATQDPVTSLFSAPLIIPEWTPPKILEDHACAYEPQENRQPFVSRVPKTIDGVEWRNYRQPYLLSQSSLELSDLAKDIGRKRGLTTLLHMGWRQQVFFGKDDSAPLHLIAGRNYGDAFDLNGKQIIEPEPELVTMPLEFDDTAMLGDNLSQTERVAVETENLVSKIQAALNSSENIVDIQQLIYLSQQPPTLALETLDGLISVEKELEPETDVKLALPDIWELDGQLTIFLRYIGRTPYLHIDGNVDFRAPVVEASASTQNQSESQNDNDANQRLQSFEFKQMRRVISKQLHYFDHPLFGLLVQIRRYDLPPPVEEVQEVDTVE